MQDRTPPLQRLFLQHTAGPYKRVRGGGLFRKINEAAYPPAAERIAATAKSLGLEVAIVGKIDI